MNNRTREIALTAIFASLIFVMALVPWLGYVQIGVVSLTLIHIPVLIGGIAGGKRVSISLGLAFGLSSLLIALIRPASPADIVFQNPLVSVLPRILFGYFLYVIYVGFNKVIKHKFAATVVSFVVSTLVHTILVLVPFYFFYSEGGNFTGLFQLIWIVMISNAVFEALLAGIVGAPIAHRLQIYTRNEA
jgi:uncharacterized membrane protein